MEPISIDQSVRESCAIAQNPFSMSIGIFVVAMATSILMMRGMTASLVNIPMRTRQPQTISTTPTKGAIISGAGIPIFTNRPTPTESENRNFWIPSERKTHPTINRTRRYGMGLLAQFVRMNRWNIICLVSFPAKSQWCITVQQRHIMSHIFPILRGTSPAKHRASTGMVPAHRQAG